MCIFSFHGCKIKLYSWRSKSRVFSKCISGGHACRNMGHNQRQIAKFYAFVHNHRCPFTIVSSIIFVVFGEKAIAFSKFQIYMVSYTCKYSEDYNGIN